MFMTIVKLNGLEINMQKDEQPALYRVGFFVGDLRFVEVGDNVGGIRGFDCFDELMM